MSGKTGDGVGQGIFRCGFRDRPRVKSQTDFSGGCPVSSLSVPTSSVFRLSIFGVCEWAAVRAVADCRNRGVPTHFQFKEINGSSSTRPRVDVPRLMKGLAG